jgi:hypothetical protein
VARRAERAARRAVARRADHAARPAAMIAAAGLATALLAGCTAGLASAPPGPSGQRVQQVLRAWSAFPASASPRPLILAGPRITDPRSGFPTGAAKLAYLEGAFDLLATLPPGPAAAAGFPLISSRAAAGVLRSAAAKRPPTASRLTVTSVRLGTGLFATDRGSRELPAWLFGFAGVPDPAAVLAVAPSRIFAPPAGRASSASPEVSARLGPDQRTLTIRLVGAAPGTGPCTASYSVRQAASPAAVAVAVHEHAHGGAACFSMGYLRQVKLVLPAPLGGRVLVDAASGAAIPVTVAAPAAAGPAATAPASAG